MPALTLSSAAVLILGATVGCTADLSVPGDDGGAPLADDDQEETSSETSPAEQCDNGLDDDGDGLIDEGCSCTAGEQQACWPGEPSRRGVGACTDGVQECVGVGEFGGWGSCERAVGPSAEVPGNGVDEDCDGTDPHPQCAESEFGESCGNSRDDDCDGHTDCGDPDCENECEPTDRGTSAVACFDAETAGDMGCSNGADDDCDDLIDCDDPDCQDECDAGMSMRTCTHQEFSTADGCSNGVDDDCDQRLDCDDPDCAGQRACQPVWFEDTVALCTNGLDDDENGRTDCEDWACEELSVCQSNGCVCQPGSSRWCHVDGPCFWGRQTCQPDGTWGPCEETTAIPESCDVLEFGGWEEYDVQCCIDSGGCCDNQDGDYTLWDPTLPIHASVGNCTNVCM